MKQFLLDVVAPLRREGAGRADRPLHWLLAAAIVLPLAVFVAARRSPTASTQRGAGPPAAQSRHRLRARREGARDDRARSRYLDEMFETSPTTDPRQRSRLQPPHQTLTDTLPQFADIWIVGADGHPLVSGTVFPIPRELDLSDRDYFRAHRNARSRALRRRRGHVARHQQRGQPRASSRSAANGTARTAVSPAPS
jgi:hypothetical protein